MRKVTFIVLVLLCSTVCLLWHRNTRLREERNRHRNNTEAMMSELKRMQIDSTTVAIDTKALLLTVDEYKRLREEDAQKIKDMGIKIRNLQAAALHKIEVSGPIDATIMDTVFIRDTVPVVRQKVEMITPHIQLTGIIENNRLKGQIRVPATLRQAVWIEYKRRWLFWKRVKAVHQTISSDNPYVEVVYSEYIVVQ